MKILLIEYYFTPNPKLAIYNKTCRHCNQRLICNLLLIYNLFTKLLHKKIIFQRSKKNQINLKKIIMIQQNYTCKNKKKEIHLAKRLKTIQYIFPFLRKKGKY